MDQIPFSSLTQKKKKKNVSKLNYKFSTYLKGFLLWDSEI